MSRIRTKLVLALLTIALLPVYPVYYLVQNLVQQSIEVGYNQNVEKALGAALDISREFYGNYRQETLQLARKYAGSKQVHRLLLEKQFRTKDAINLTAVGVGKMEIYTAERKLVYSKTSEIVVEMPRIYEANLAQLSVQASPQLLEGLSGKDRLIAFAPIENQGFLILFRAVEPEFLGGMQTIVRVNQMFKTLDFFENDLTRSFLLAFFVIYLPIAILSVALGIYFSRKVTSPLLQLVQGTKEVAEGDWDYRIRVTSKDEVGQLGSAFNEMVSTLREKQDQVVSLEKMAAWREIARVLAHEIKNPLTPIQLMVQQMQDKYQGNDAEYKKLLAECTEIVSDEIESLRTLVREFSEFARMPQLQFAPGDLNALIEEVRRIYANDNIELMLDDNIPELSFDHEKLRRVLINLLENSMDSIREKGSGEVCISTQLDSENVILTCRDSGNGIPEEIKSKIFEPYFSTKKSGMGLGMAIVQRIIWEHGGRIEVESEVGKGTRFVIYVPLERVG